MVRGDLQHLRRVHLVVLTEGLVDIMQTHSAVLSGIPESSVGILEELVHGVGFL